MIITFTPQNIKYHANLGENLLSVAALAGVFVDGTCGGKGICGKCKVKVLSGDLEPIKTHEIGFLTKTEVLNGYRLACKIFIESDMDIELPITNHATCRKTKLNYLPDDFLPEVKEKYGVAYDIGTTTVVAMLWNLKTGELLEAVAQTNPQSIYGADVISRINFCGEKPENLKQIQKKIIDCMNELAVELFEKAEVKAEDISEMVAVGNTTMSHLLLGIDPGSLARAPFEPAFNGSRSVDASELGLLEGKGSGGLELYILPNIAGHVGSDIVAGILSSRLRELVGTNLSIDIGTNGEVALFHEGKTLVCSTAAGPAFEGASIKHGMRAASGAIEAVSYKDGKILLDTIDDKAPVGICGSGLIDAVALLLETGVIDKKGKMLDKEAAEAANMKANIVKRMRKIDGINEFVIAFGGGDAGREAGRDAGSEAGGDAGNEAGRNAVAPPDIVITQKDVREVQLAKGAIQAGITCLLNLAGITSKDIDRVILAGAFGNYINKKSALRIGMLPQLPLEKIVSVGNAAGSGASMALLSLRERAAASKIAETAIHVELSTEPGFQDEFLKSMYFI